MLSSNEMYKDIKDNWQIAMAGTVMTFEEFTKEPIKDQAEFYSWFRVQTNDVLHHGYRDFPL